MIWEPTRLRARRQTGAVTAETAIVLPVLLVLLLVGLWAAGAVVAGLRCTDAARDTARAVARGEPPDVARKVGARVAPTGADIEIDQEGSEVRVVVNATIRPDWLLVGSPTITVQGRSVVEAEVATVDEVLP